MKALHNALTGERSRVRVDHVDPDSPLHYGCEGLFG
jgi:hypothetical protein